MVDISDQNLIALSLIIKQLVDLKHHIKVLHKDKQIQLLHIIQTLLLIKHFNKLCKYLIC